MAYSLTVIIGHFIIDGPFMLLLLVIRMSVCIPYGQFTYNSKHHSHQLVFLRLLYRKFEFDA